jgi:hypothetical protein
MNTLEKPLIGEKCNRYRLCCMIQVCMNGAYAMRLVNKLGDTVKGKCPALIENEDKTYSCGVVKTPFKFIKSKFQKKAKIALKVVHGIKI